MNTIVFPNDNYVNVKVDLSTSYGTTFSKRTNAEIMFRRLISFLIRSSILDNRKSIIDLGAWIGDNAVPWALMISGTVYAIDPSPENCRFIAQTCQMNNILNCKIIERAISDTETLLSTNDELHHCSFVYNNPGTNGRNKLTATSLDELHNKNEITNIGFIHLDVEGMEWQVLKGSENLINSERPIVAYEVHLNTDIYINDIKIFLQKKNYKIYMINETMPHCRPDCRNFIALPKELIAADFCTILAKEMQNDNILVAQ